MRRNKYSAWNIFNRVPTMENFSYALTKDKLYSDKELDLNIIMKGSLHDK